MTITKRIRPRARGKPLITWQVWYQEDGKRHNKTFARKRDARQWIEYMAEVDRMVFDMLFRPNAKIAIGDL